MTGEDEVTGEDDAVSKEDGISAEDEVRGEDGTSEEYTPSQEDDATGEDEATIEYEATREYETTREHEGIRRGAGGVAAWQHISRSLERIEHLLVDQYRETKRLRKVMVKQTGDDSGSDSVGLTGPKRLSTDIAIDADTKFRVTDLPRGVATGRIHLRRGLTLTVSSSNLAVQ
ncbi:hypothetical protein CC80DRAFT_59241 [Byssothecium circinans]|uniref:Uncharacterized protein n=1 Tax=Byssothecium circinans TaxID=147558 RepID=A0A6A5TU79_9PLEO|nr:hypothetical protein CC80DRAFT_59241 [Byssothecium circinans]